MLKYLIATIEYLIVPAVLTGMVYGYLPQRGWRHTKKALTASTIAGILAAAVMAYMKNRTKLVRGEAWNIRIFSATIILFLIFLIADALLSFKKALPVSLILASLSACLLVFFQLFYGLPDVIAYPYTIVLNGDVLFSSGFLYRAIGVVLGVLLSVLTCACVRFVCKKADAPLTGALLKIGFALICLQMGLKIVSILRARKILPKGTLFAYTSFSANHASWYIYGVLLLALVPPVVLLVKSFHVNEPYENAAQLRKIKASWRSVRRWSVVAIACFFAAFLNVTTVKAYANRPVALSEIEACAMEDGYMVIPFEQVEDGHLHRFAYTTDQGVEVRFIIIKKPNSSAYGIGLDACDICGETGYYERSGQVICNRCDVIMNINTIGFKGGCNPIPIAYEIADGSIRIAISALDTEEYNKLFK